MKITRTQLISEVLSELSNHLKPHGFKKKSSWFERSNGNLVHYIHIQGNASADQCLQVTINVSISSNFLQNKYPGLFFSNEPGVGPIHRRIGSFLPVFQDKWWTVDSIESVPKVISEMYSLLVDLVLPYLDSIWTPADLANRLRTDSYLNFGEARSRYLADALEGKEDPDKNPWTHLRTGGPDRLREV